jgi:hypothetical protein
MKKFENFFRMCILRGRMHQTSACEPMLIVMSEANYNKNISEQNNIWWG